MAASPCSSRNPDGVCRQCFAVLADLAVLALGVLAVFALDRFSEARSFITAVISKGDLTLLLVSVAAACAAMAAILAAVAHRLSGDRRVSWLSAAFALYGVVGVPATTLSGSLGRGGVPLDAARFAAHLGTAVLVGIAVWGPRRRRWTRPVFISFVAALSVAGVAALAWAEPVVVRQVIGSAEVRALIGLISVLGAGALILVAVLERSRPLARVGVAMIGLATAHVYRVLDGQPGMSLPFASIRLLALSFALAGFLQLTGRTLVAVREAEVRRREELERARTGLAHAAERDHELRTRLASLARVADLLGEPNGEESRELRTAVRAELVRLESMLADEQAGAAPQVRAYPVVPMIQDLVTLRRCAGMDIRCEADGSPWADGSPTVLKQVLSNVLANCARHAPGSPVRIEVADRQDCVELRVTDSGPGITAGQEHLVFERGVCSQVGGGQGLGLHICRELLIAEGGKIEILPSPTMRAGCTVVVEVPKAKCLGARPATVARVV